MADGGNSILEVLGDGELVSYDAKQNRCVLRFTARPSFCHSGGRVVQGGFVAGWIDCAMAQVINLATDGGMGAATLELKVNFLESTPCAGVEVSAWIERLGRSIAFVEGELRTLDGRRLATASSTIKLVRRDRSAA